MDGRGLSRWRPGLASTRSLAALRPHLRTEVPELGILGGATSPAPDAFTRTYRRLRVAADSRQNVATAAVAGGDARLQLASQGTST